MLKLARKKCSLTKGLLEPVSQVVVNMVNMLKLACKKMFTQQWLVGTGFSSFW